MGKTYRRAPEQEHNRKKPKHLNHSNNKKLGGMRVVNRFNEEDDDYFDDEVNIKDEIIINKNGEQQT